MSAPKIETYGQIGSPIPGSRLVRDYCATCGEPIRVTSCGGEHICSSCRAGWHPGYGTPFYVPDTDADGVWANIVKKVEDGR